MCVCLCASSLKVTLQISKSKDWPLIKQLQMASLVFVETHLSLLHFQHQPSANSALICWSVSTCARALKQKWFLGALFCCGGSSFNIRVLQGQLWSNKSHSKHRTPWLISSRMDSEFCSKILSACFDLNGRWAQRDWSQSGVPLYRFQEIDPDVHQHLMGSGFVHLCNKLHTVQLGSFLCNAADQRIALKSHPDFPKRVNMK